LAAEPQTKRDTAAARYSALASIRDDWVNRARIAGRLTLPYLIPENDDDGDGAAEQYRLPWNGIGQKGVHNLASRLMLSQLPPTEANFRFVFDEPKLAMFERELEKAGATEEQLAEQKAEWDKTLAMFERATLRSIEISNDRVTILEALQHAIVGGNALLYDSDREGMRCFHLQRYVLLRDSMGNPREAVICERMDRQSLPPQALEMLAGSGPPPEEGATTASRVDRTIKVYTVVRLESAGGVRVTHGGRRSRGRRSPTRRGPPGSMLPPGSQFACSGWMARATGPATWRRCAWPICERPTPSARRWPRGPCSRHRGRKG
jgi:hypothetical protein